MCGTIENENKKSNNALATGGHILICTICSMKVEACHNELVAYWCHSELFWTMCIASPFYSQGVATL